MADKPRIKRTLYGRTWVCGVFRTPKSPRPVALGYNFRKLIELLKEKQNAKR
jgi:hypothetical protein